MTSGENRSTGRDLLRHYNLAGEEDTTLNFLGGLLTEMAVDPLNLIGGALVGRKALQRSGPLKANRAIRKNVEPRVVREGPSVLPTDEFQYIPTGADPDTLYHVSPFGSEIEETGRLLAWGKGGHSDLKTASGDPLPLVAPRGLGAAGESGVSLTVNPRAASDMERWFKALAEIGESGRKARPEDAIESMLGKYFTASEAELGELMRFAGDDVYEDVGHLARQFDTEHHSRLIEALTDPSSDVGEVASLLGRKFEELLVAFESAAGRRGQHPTAPFSAGGSSLAVNVSPENIRTFEIPTSSIPEGAQMEEGIDRWEYLLGGDLPLEGATVHGAPGGSYTYELPFEDVPSLSPLLKALTAERVVNKGLNQFPSGGYYEDPIY